MGKDTCVAEGDDERNTEMSCFVKKEIMSIIPFHFFKGFTFTYSEQKKKKIDSKEESEGSLTKDERNGK